MTRVFFKMTRLTTTPEVERKIASKKKTRRSKNLTDEHGKIDI